MKLNWVTDPSQQHIRRATTAAYQYTLFHMTDGRARVEIKHRGDRASATPIKRFDYKTVTGAEAAASRFEQKHGYRDPAHHAPAEVAPFLKPLPSTVRSLVDESRRKMRAASLAFRVSKSEATKQRYEQYDREYVELCAALLCCTEHACFNRTEVGTDQCAAHGNNNENEEN